MKQDITEEQYNELTEDQKKVWYQWCFDHHYTMNEIYKYSGFDEKLIRGFPSIGEMIEFLEDHTSNELGLVNLHGEWQVNFGEYDHNFSAIHNELCDALWKAVKEVLKK